MAQIYGQIESLKRLRSELNSKRINRFSSIKDIQTFFENFQSEKDAIVFNQQERLITEIDELKNAIFENIRKSERIRNDVANDLDIKISDLKQQIEITEKRCSGRFVYNLLGRIKLGFQKRELVSTVENYSKIIQSTVDSVEQEIERDSNTLEYISKNAQKVLDDRCFSEINQLNYIKEVLKGLNSLIYGAIGESQVVKEIEKLSDDFVLINDFSIQFYPPLHRKSSDDWIYSIQVDHLLISKAGIFVLETKNWSKKSIESLDLRSPVEQIRRSSYAIFILISDAIERGKLKLNQHHWGNKQIQVKNIIVMLNEKPKEEFQYVKIKTLSELNRFISLYDENLSDDEVRSIADYFIKIQDK